MPFISRLVAADRHSEVGKSLTQSQPAKPNSVPELAEIVDIFFDSAVETSPRVALVLTDGECDIVALLPRKLYVDRLERAADLKSVPIMRLVKVRFDGLEILSSNNLSVPFRDFLNGNPVLSVTDITYLGPGGVLPNIARQPVPRISPFLNKPQQAPVTPTVANSIASERLVAHMPTATGPINFPIPIPIPVPVEANTVDSTTNSITKNDSMGHIEVSENITKEGTSKGKRVLPGIERAREKTSGSLDKTAALESARSGGFFSSLKRRLGLSPESQKKFKSS